MSTALDFAAHDPGTGAVLLAGAAPFVPHALPEEVKGLPVIAVDGGIHAMPSAFLWAGDGDSGFQPRDIPSFVKNSQDLTDLAFTFAGIRNWVWHDVHLAGFWGSRMDHTLAVLGTLQAEMKQRALFSRAVLYGPLGNVAAVMLPAGEDHLIVVEGRFSIMALEGAMVTLDGDCDYRAGNLVLPPLSGLGVSNNGHGSVSLATDAPVFVMFPT